MKKIITLVLPLLLIIGPTVHAEPISSTSVSGPSRMALGFATLSSVAGVGALSVLHEFNPWNSIQGVFAISDTTPFQFAVGGIYRSVVTGGTSEGLHLGGGLLMGSTSVAGSSEFYMRVSGLGGAHFTLPGMSRLQLSFDGGAHLDILNGNVDFRVGTLSPALGLSVHYFL